MIPTLPQRARRAAGRAMRELTARHLVPHDNILHCCVQKTASRWVRRLLADPIIYKYSKAEIFDYEVSSGAVDSGKLSRDLSGVEFPKKTIVTPLYIDYPTFTSLRNLEGVRAFMVVRDPRDIVVSWYFSMMISHPTKGGKLDGIRQELQELDKEDGLLHAIWALDERAGMWNALRSWVDAERARTMVVKFRDLTSPDEGPAVFKRIMDHCDIPVPFEDVKALYDRHSFEKMSGRKRGQEDEGAHLRKGVAGDWKNHFSPRVMARLREASGDLVEALGYE